MQLTQLLQNLPSSDRDAINDIIPLVYDELKKLARSHLRREGAAFQFQTTALVHETFLKLAGSRHPLYENRGHFYGIASRIMRQILVDTARARTTSKRDVRKEVAFTDLMDWEPRADRSLLALDDALQCLEKTDPRKGQIIEMRYFGGLTAEETSEALSMPVHTVRRELRLAQAWLRKEIAGTESMAVSKPAA